MNASEAADAVARTRPLAAGERTRATELTRRLWHVTFVDEQDRPLAGGSSVVGPDRRIWSVSSNPWIHEFDLAVAAIDALYEAGAADRVDDDRFDSWLRDETDRRRSVLPDLVAAAVAGSLRRPERRLP